MSDVPLVLDVLVASHAPNLPPFVVVPAASLPWPLTGTTTIVGTLNGVDLGRRSLKRWDADRWFLDLSKPLLARTGLAAGDTARLAITLAPTDPPPELSAALAEDPALAAAWEAMSAPGKRMLREELWTVASPATRRRRIERALRPPAPEPVPTGGLGADWVAIAVHVEGHALPGAACGPYREIAVGLQVGEVGQAFAPGDAPTVGWTTPVEVRAADDGPRFRGDAVHGPTRDRFLYLVWRGREGAGPPALFRRAKLLLRAVEPAVLAAAVRARRLSARVHLTDAKGMPRCASVLPPAITWTVGDGHPR